jgi:hypothetical protein
MTANSSINIPPGLKLRLLNGTVLLPEGGIISISPGAALEMVRISIYGRGRYEHGLVDIQGQGATALLRQCTITGTRNHLNHSGGHGVRVSQGGDAILDRCWLSKAGFCGLWVEGLAYARGCFASRCFGSGYAARRGGRLTVARSVAIDNPGSGFIANGQGSTVVAWEGCRAENNRGAGFYASGGGELVAGCDCVAKNNFHSVFMALGPGSSMQVGPGCTAEDNGNEYYGWLDFGAESGAVLLMPPA